MKFRASQKKIAAIYDQRAAQYYVAVLIFANFIANIVQANLTTLPVDPPTNPSDNGNLWVSMVMSSRGDGGSERTGRTMVCMHARL